MDASVWWQIRPTLRSGGFGWDTELLAIAASAGIPVSEHPVEWVDQPGTTVGITDPMRMLRQLVAAHRRASDTPTRQTAPNRTLRRESLRNTEPSVTDLGGDRIHRTARRQGSRLLSSLIRSLQTPTAWLTALGLLLYLPGLGGYPLRTWDEAICAMAARYAVERGDYVFPHLYWLASSSEIVYQPFLEKPSLSMWLMSISMALHRVRSPTATGPCRRSRRTSDVSRDTLGNREPTGGNRWRSLAHDCVRRDRQQRCSGRGNGRASHACRDRVCLDRLTIGERSDDQRTQPE